MGLCLSIAQTNRLGLLSPEASCKGFYGGHRVILALLSPSKRLTLLCSLQQQGA